VCPRIGGWRDRPSSHRTSLGAAEASNLRCPKFRDHVNFDARAEWHLRHTDGTARMDAAVAEHLDK
jgi:hypothetical protein